MCEKRDTRSVCLAQWKCSINVSYHYSYNEFYLYVHTFLLKCLNNRSLEAVLLGHSVSNLVVYYDVS